MQREPIALSKVGNKSKHEASFTGESTGMASAFTQGRIPAQPSRIIQDAREATLMSEFVLIFQEAAVTIRKRLRRYVYCCDGPVRESSTHD